MSDPRHITEQHQHEQRLCASLVQHPGWREVLLPLVARSLNQSDSIARDIRVSDAVRLGAIDQRHTLLALLKTIYKKADEPDPFDTARMAVWSTLLPPKAPAVPEAQQHEDAVKEALEAIARKQRRVTSGSIA